MTDEFRGQAECLDVSAGERGLLRARQGEPEQPPEFVGELDRYAGRVGDLLLRERG